MAVTLSAVGGAMHVGVNWLIAVLLILVPLHSASAAVMVWHGRSSRMFWILNASYILQVLIMALAYVYVEHIM